MSVGVLVVDDEPDIADLFRQREEASEPSFTVKVWRTGGRLRSESAIGGSGAYLVDEQAAARGSSRLGFAGKDAFISSRTGHWVHAGAPWRRGCIAIDRLIPPRNFCYLPLGRSLRRAPEELPVLAGYKVVG
jgi:hypothetical protein